MAHYYLRGMSAAEVIEQIKTLSEDERREVVAFVEQIASGEKSASGDVRTISREAFAAAKAAVFQKHDEVLRRLAQ
jgi:hypothetical protein